MHVAIIYNSHMHLCKIAFSLTVASIIPMDEMNSPKVSVSYLVCKSYGFIVKMARFH